MKRPTAGGQRGRGGVLPASGFAKESLLASRRVQVRPRLRKIAPCSLSEEWPRAEELREEAVRSVSELMARVRLGDPVEATAARQVAVDIIDSVARNDNALLSLGRVRHKDRYTFEHSVNVAVLASVLGRSLGMAANILKELALGALLHDVGKAFTPDPILKKPARLSDQEFELMKGHVVDSARVLAAMPGISQVALKAASEHHERYDGSGYPDGLSGDEISIYGQIVGICDVYDAITADRCYRQGRHPTEVLSQLLKWGGKLFEMNLIQRFIKAVGIYPVGSLVGLESGRLAVVLEVPGDSLRPVLRVFYDMRRCRTIPPEILDLSREPAVDRIRTFESPEKWQVNPVDFMR